MMDNVEHVEFGKRERETGRKLACLLGIAEQRDKELLADPVKFYDMAITEIVRLRTLLEAAREAGRLPLPAYISNEQAAEFVKIDTVIVDRAELNRLRAMHDVIWSPDARR
jgi:hypothetical protein